MHLITLDNETDFDGWRMAARALALSGVTPAEVSWNVRDRVRDPSSRASPLPDAPEGRFSVPAKFIALAHTVIRHRDSMRFALLYRLLWRLKHHHDLLDNADDPDVAQAEMMASAVLRDEARMLATLRFNEIGRERTSRYVAWFAPEHHIVEAVAPCFARRYADMPWSILTPDVCAHFDGSLISFTDGTGKAAAPSEDRLEETWRLYAANLLPSGRLHQKAQPPKRSWQTIEPAMPDVGSDAPIDPDAAMRRKAEKSAEAIETLREEAATCRACHLWKHATQTVFGEGPQHAPIMMVGEQPGDKEDLAGLPFVGPAGQMLDRAMVEAGIDRKKVYVTNAVKHFKFVPRGKIRLHQKPNTEEIRACRQWYEREIAAIKPKLVIALGATAAQCVLGKITPINKNRGHLIELAEGVKALVTVHPSYLLRLPDADAKAREYDRFVEDLKIAARMLGNQARAA
jgi:probable DNA metabolism protein